MEIMHREKWNRLSDAGGAAFFFLLLISIWMGGVVQAGEPERITPAEGKQYQGFWIEEEELYYYDQCGELQTEEFVRITDRDGTYCYYFQADGSAAEGLTEIGEDMWYFFDENHVMVISDIAVIGDQTWYFGADGRADWMLQRFE